MCADIRLFDPPHAVERGGLHGGSKTLCFSAQTQRSRQQFRHLQAIAQQVFIRVWKSAARYQPTAKFTTWLFKIARNLVFNELRRRKRHPVTPLQHEEEEHFFQPADSGGMTPDASLLDSELNDAIQMAIDALPETQRLAIILRRYEEMPYEEIGEILNLSVPAVKSVLFRARAELRQQLRKYLDA